MNTIRLTVGQALVRFLDQQYIERDGEESKFVTGVIGIFGHGNVLGFGEALANYDNPDFAFIGGKNEQDMSHIATGYAKQNNRMKIFACTSSIGPGAANMVTAAATATVNRIPALYFPSDAYATRQPDPVLQQVETAGDYAVTTNDAFKAVCKYWDRVHRPEQLMTACINAFRVLTDPAETGACCIALPQDVQGEAYDYPEYFFQKRVWSVERRPIEGKKLEALTDLILQKRRPVLICGGGVGHSSAAAEVMDFCESFHVPMVETAAGKGLVPWDKEYNLGGGGTTGNAAANRMLHQADLILAVGARLNDFITCSKSGFREDAALVSININRFDSFKMDAVSVQSDAKAAMGQLNEALKKRGWKSSYTDEYAKEKRAWLEEVAAQERLEDPDGLRMTKALQVLNRSVEDDAIIVAASGSLPGELQKAWRVKTPGTYHLEYGYSCMGYEISGALGAKIAEPDRQVYSLMGDGVFFMAHSDIHTSLQEHKKIIIIVFDNMGHQCIHELQNANGIDTFGTDFRFRSGAPKGWTDEKVPVDFAMIARGYGAKGYTARTAEEFQEALEKAQKEEITTLIDVKTTPFSWLGRYESWWRVGLAEVSEKETVREARKDIDARLKTARQY